MLLHNNISRRRPLRDAIGNTALAVSGLSSIAVELCELALDELRNVRLENALDNARTRAELEAEASASAVTSKD
jgi:hypothetical protein